jgi:N-acyl-D-amino-acid deacylase
VFPTRRAFLAASAAGLAAPLAAAEPAELPVAGRAVRTLAPFDDLMTKFVRDYKVPGAALAVTRNGALVYARGFGYADRDAKTPVQPNSLFRIASISKPFTAVAALRLVERGKLALDDRVLDRMELKPADVPGQKPDPRWGRVTVRHCLQHTGGWDRAKSFDPIGRPRDVAKVLGLDTPPGPVHVIRYMMGRGLDFDPGERYAYSNLGYLILGRIIETVSGHGYEPFVRYEVLSPLRIHRMQIGRAPVASRAAGEVRYYETTGAKADSIYPPDRGAKVPVADGAMNVEGFEAHGGWIASAVDLVRFASAFDTPSKCPLLSEDVIREMWARPDGRAGYRRDKTPTATYYGLGWMVRPTANGVTAFHSGLIGGTSTLMVRRADGLTWAVLFNADRTPGGDVLSGRIDAPLHDAAARVLAWPDTDQFEKG